MGEYFGGAVAVADVNGDGKDDIIVGSPLYTYHTVCGMPFFRDFCLQLEIPRLILISTISFDFKRRFYP
jgi:FG-GAP repeat